MRRGVVFSFIECVSFSEDTVTQQAKRPKTEKRDDAMDVDEEGIVDPEFLQVSFGILRMTSFTKHHFTESIGKSAWSGSSI